MKHAIPDAALDKHVAFLGANGSGKTSAGKSAIIEPALEAGERVLNIDPTGVGWGLRVSKSGKGSGYPIAIFGGEHADYPLAVKDAAMLAEAYGTSSGSAVFDTSLMTVEDRTQWFTKFAETLLRKNKGKLKLVIDEAHLFMPQAGAKSGGGVPKMLHAGNNLISLGRSRGLRITLISQRPAKLHKDALSQAKTLVAMQMMAPQDRNAVKDWMEDQADAATGKEIIASLPSLQPGEGWVWFPLGNYLECVKFSRPSTFDSSAAPEDDVGDGPKLVPINLDALKGKLATIEAETKANDPKALKAENARLRNELSVSVSKSSENIPDLNALADAEQRGFEQARKKLTGAIEKAARESLVHELEVLRTTFEPMAGALTAAIKAAKAADLAVTMQYTPAQRSSIVRPIASARPQSAPRPKANGHPPEADLPKGEKLCLAAMAQYADGVTRQQLTVVTGYKRSTRDAYIQRLRERGYVDLSGERVIATDAGIAALGSDYEPLPTGEALREHVLPRLPEGERRVLELLIGQYPGQVEREAIDEATGFQRSTRDAYLMRLKARELVEVCGRGAVKAADELFDAN